MSFAKTQIIEFKFDWVWNLDLKTHWVFKFWVACSSTTPYRSDTTILFPQQPSLVFRPNTILLLSVLHCTRFSTNLYVFLFEGLTATPSHFLSTWLAKNSPDVHPLKTFSKYSCGEWSPDYWSNSNFCNLDALWSENA